MKGLSKYSFSHIIIVIIIMVGFFAINIVSAATGTVSYCKSYDPLTFSVGFQQGSDCGTAAGAITTSFPTGGLCQAGTFFLPQILTVAVLANSAIDTSFNPGDGPNKDIVSIALQPDGKIIIGGNFTTFGRNKHQYISRLDSDGFLDESFDPGAGANNQIKSVILQPDGKIIVGGQFTTFDGEPRNRIARLNSNGSLDTTFDPGNGADSDIISVALQTEGKIIVGGDFKNFDGIFRNRIARLNPDGSLDTTFDTGDGANGAIYSIVQQSDKKILIGGAFTTFNGESRNRIARLNPDGPLDTTFDPKDGADDTIRSIALQSDKQILIGGAFTTFGGVGRNRIARLNLDGSLDDSFDPGLGANFGNGPGGIKSITVLNDERIIIGGYFSTFNDITRHRIAKLNPDGSLDDSFDPGDSNSDSISTVVLQSDGKIIVGGWFSTFAGVSRNNIARLGNSVPGEIYTWECLTPQDNFNTAICGSIEHIPGGTRLDITPTNYCTKGTVLIRGRIPFGTDGCRSDRGCAQWTCTDTPPCRDTAHQKIYNYCAIAHTLDPTRDVKLFIETCIIGKGLDTCGSIQNTCTDRNEQKAYNACIIATPNAENATPTEALQKCANGLMTCSTIKNTSILPVTCTAPYTALVIAPILTGTAGVCGTANGGLTDTFPNTIANSGVNLDNNFVLNVQDKLFIYSRALQPDGKLLIVGNTTNSQGWSNGQFLRLDNNKSSIDLSFNAGEVNQQIRTVAVQPNGKIVIGGAFTTYNGQSANRIARLNSNGSLDTTFNPGLGFNGSPLNISIQADGKIVVIGGFTNFSGQARNGIARLNSNGSLDTSFNVGQGFNTSMRGMHGNGHMEIQPDGKIIIGAHFTGYNGQSANRIIRLNTNGSRDTTFDIGEGFNAQVRNIKIQSDGKILVGGDFVSYNGQSTNTRGIVRLNSNGSRDNSFVPAVQGSTAGIAIQPDGKIILGGSWIINGQTTHGVVVRLNPNGSRDTTFNPTMQQVAGNYTANAPSISSVILDQYNGIIINGSFDTYGGAPRNGIVRLKIGVTNNLCAVGTPYLQQTNIGNPVSYTWSCIGMGSGAQIVDCVSYQNPQSNSCVPYNNTPSGSGATPININNVLLPNTQVAVMLNYNFATGNFANINLEDQLQGQDNVIVATTGSTIYTNNSAYSLTGIINPNLNLRVTFTNLNTQGTSSGQFIQYRQPSSLSERTMRSTLKNKITGGLKSQQNSIAGSNRYGCNAQGWNVSLAGFIPNELVYNPVSLSSSNQIAWLNTVQHFQSFKNSSGEWVVFIPSVGLVNINKPEEKFLVWKRLNKGFDVTCEVCTTTQPTTTQTGTCVGLPDHALPNTVTSITQYTGVDGWFPSTDYMYNTVPSTTECTFVCENNYTRSDGECKPNTETRKCAGAMPQHAIMTVPGSNTYTSTRNGMQWAPSLRTYTYDSTVYSNPILNACNYTCPIHFTRTRGTCVPTTPPPRACNGTLPANATTNNGLTTFSQTRNGNNWNPISGIYTHGYGICGFLCNTNYTRNTATLTCNPSTRIVACGGALPTDGTPTNGNTYTQTRNGSIWAPTVSWTLGGTSACGYTTNVNPVYDRGTGDWSTCTGGITTGATNTYARDIGERGPCSLRGGTCNGFYPTATTGGSCTNNINSNGGFGFSSCSTMDFGYNLGGLVVQNGNAAICGALTTSTTCNAMTSHNCRWFGLGSGSTSSTTSSTSLATCQQAITQNTCAGEVISTPGNQWGGIGYSYTSGGIAGCSWERNMVSTSCNDTNNEIMCVFRPGCDWNAHTGGALQTRPVACKNQMGVTVIDSFCTVPKPPTTQSGTCNTPANGICGSALGVTSIASPTDNLCSVGYPGAAPTSFTGTNGGLIRYWSCQGIAGGTNSFCLAPQADPASNGVCGTPHNKFLITSPTTNLCANGIASAVNGNGPWSRSCNGQNGGSTASCTAYKQSGVCGNANGQVFNNIPNSGLCASGVASVVAGNGPWTWSCSTQNSTPNASCGATRSSGNTYVCQVNGNWSSAGALCSSLTPVNTITGYTPSQSICTTTQPSHTLCNLNIDTTTITG